MVKDGWGDGGRMEGRESEGVDVDVAPPEESSLAVDCCLLLAVY